MSEIEERWPPQGIGGAAQITSGTLAARPAAGVADRYYWATDIDVVFRDTGAAWEVVEGQYYRRLIWTVWGVALPTNLSPIALRVYVEPFEVEHTCTIDTLVYYRGAGALAGGEQVLMGIYADGGDAPATGALLASTLVTACIAGVSQPQEIALITPVRLTPGLYWIAWVFDTATVSLGTRYSTDIWNSATATLRSHRYNVVAMAFTDPCPATLHDGQSKPAALYVVSNP